MTTLLNIAALSRRTGVAPDTLRKWEQRYGVLHPTRTSGRQRRYTEQDIQRVEWLRDRLVEGWRIGEAARVLEQSVAAPLDDPAGLRDALVEAVLGNDPSQASAILDQAFAVLPLEQALGDVADPALHAVGEAWHRGEISVAPEHALSARVRSRIDELLADTRGGVRGTAVLACAPTEQHDLGLLMLAVMLRADGWRVEYLGANMPVVDAVDFAEAVGATILCFSATREDSLRLLRDGLDAVGRRPGPALVLGGAAVSPEVARDLNATFAEGRLGKAVGTLRKLSSTSGPAAMPSGWRLRSHSSSTS